MNFANYTQLFPSPFSDLVIWNIFTKTNKSLDDDGDDDDDNEEKRRG